MKNIQFICSLIKCCCDDTTSTQLFDQLRSKVSEYIWMYILKVLAASSLQCSAVKIVFSAKTWSRTFQPLSNSSTAVGYKGNWRQAGDVADQGDKLLSEASLQGLLCVKRAALWNFTSFHIKSHIGNGKDWHHANLDYLHNSGNKSVNQKL